MKYLYKRNLIILIIFLLKSCYNLDDFKKNVSTEGYIYIENDNINKLITKISCYVKDLKSFTRCLLDNKINICKGKYKINLNDSNFSILHKIDKCRREQVKLKINNDNYTISHICKSISEQVGCNYIDLLNYIKKISLSKNIPLEKCKIYFLPETYYIYWGDKEYNIINKLLKYYKKIWNIERIKKCNKLGMSIDEIIILASIVQLEYSDKDSVEQGKIARVYINRLKNNMKLQSDPTAIYSYKKENGWDIKINRVTGLILKSNTLYNTYKYKGLPPTPICLPNLSTIDAVLNCKEHNYIFFVKDINNLPKHIFSTSYDEHIKYVRKYRDYINYSIINH